MLIHSHLKLLCVPLHGASVKMSTSGELRVFCTILMWMKTHGLKAAEILNEKGYKQEIIEAIKMHNEEASGLIRSEKFHHALAACETITGLIFATTMVYPDKKLSSVKAKSITKRMKEKIFAASVNRETILECEKIGIPIDEFAEISLKALQEISGELGF